MLLKKHQWAEAEAPLRRAWALNPTYDVAANLGQTQYRLGKLRDAAEHLDFALRHWPLIGKPEPRKLAEDRLAEVRGSVGALKLEVKAEHADLYVDGKLVGHSPMVGEVFVEPGAHKVEARHELYGTEARRVIAGVGATEAVRFGLGEVVVGVGPAAAGSGVPSVGPPVVPKAGPNRGVLVAGGVTAGAALVAGVAFAVAANARAGNVASQRDAILKIGVSAGCGPMPSPACQAIRSMKRDQETFSNLAAWSFIVAGAAGAGTALYAVVAPRISKRSGTRVLPLVATDGGGVVVRGDW